MYTGNDGMLGASVLNIPMNKEKDIVGDFTLVGDTLYIGRTTNPSSYKGLSIQGYNLLTGASTIANDIVTNYVPWIIPKTRNNQLGAGPYNSSVFFQ